MKKLFILFAAVAIIGFVGCSRDKVRPSGNIETKTYNFKDFSSIHIGSSIEVELTRSEEESFVIDADDNMFEYLIVEKSGNEVKVHLKQNLLILDGRHHIKVWIGYKNLTELELLNASVGLLNPDSTQFNNVEFNLSYSSVLKGNIWAKNASFDLGDASKFEGNVNADNDVEFNLSYSSVLRGNIWAKNASFDLSDASKFVGSINADSSIKMDLSYSSGLEGYFNSDNADVRLETASKWIARGSCKSIILVSRNSSTSECFGLACENLDASLSVASKGEHSVSKILKVNLSDASLYYKGEPSITQTLSGSSILEQR
jgi:hypothetical protein